MRELIYILADGTIVTTWNEAKASGQTYRVTLREVRRKRTDLSPLRKLCLERFGRVTPEYVERIKKMA